MSTDARSRTSHAMRRTRASWPTWFVASLILRNPLPPLRNLHRGHAASCRSLYAHICVFGHQPVCRRHTQPLRGEEKAFRVGFALNIVSGADQSVEAVEDIQSLQGGCYGIACAP